MNDSKRILQGSETRDVFKRVHKNTSGRHYACDLDFVLVEKFPPGIVAFIDYKGIRDRITFSEVLAYNALTKVAPIYIVKGSDPEHGPFEVSLYLGGNSKPEPPEVDLRFVVACKDWDALEAFECRLREQYKLQRNGDEL